MLSFSLSHEQFGTVVLFSSLAYLLSLLHTFPNQGLSTATQVYSHGYHQVAFDSELERERENLSLPS